MLGHGAKFGRKKEQAIVALLTYRNVEDAARAVGISANTLLRWMRDPEFEAAYREARRRVFCQAIERLQNAAGAAVTTILKAMVDPNERAGIHLRAAEVVLERAVATGERGDLEDRVTKLERMVGSGTKSPRRSDLTWLPATPLHVPATTTPQIAAPHADNADTDDTAETDEDDVA